MRGHQNIFTSVLFEEFTPKPLPLVERKGRSDVLKQRQNELIAHRYYYYIKLQRRIYEDAIAIVSDEIMLAPITLIRIIDSSDVLKQLQTLKPDVKYFRNKYPWLVWDNPIPAPASIKRN